MAAGFAAIFAREADVGVISESEAAQWIKELEKVSQNNRFFGAVTGFGVCGRKP